jgi:hypothetical protein
MTDYCPVPDPPIWVKEKTMDTQENKIELPDVSDVDLAFPTVNAETSWVPKYKDIPDEFRIGRSTKWNKLFEDMFYFGVKDLKLIPKEGVDPERAYRLLQCLKGSFGLKHEHKTSAFAYLASQWFEDVYYEVLERG